MDKVHSQQPTRLMIIPKTCIIKEIRVKSRGSHGGWWIHLKLMQEVKTAFLALLMLYKIVSSR